jgi:hypothetical protein
MLHALASLGSLVWLGLNGLLWYAKPSDLVWLAESVILVIGIAMQIPTRHAGSVSFRERIRSNYVETFNMEKTMDEKRIARLFGLTLGGLFAISLILTAITI